MRLKLVVILSLLCSLFSINEVRATHIMGGEITWECQNNGQYIFVLKVYRDCNGINFGTNNLALEAHNYPTTGVVTLIPLNFFSVTDITPSCQGSPCATLSQSDPDIPGAVEEYILRSNPTTIAGVPPANGWTFSWTSGNRNAAIDNIQNASNFGITLRAVMFPYNARNANPCFDSSPDFFQKPSTIICGGEQFTYNHSAYDNELDSLVYTWAQPLDGQFCNPTPCQIGGVFQKNVNPAILPFDAGSGYTFDSPFPDTNLDSRNIPAVLDPITGEITFTSFNTGEFVSVIQVDAYKCGIKVAEIYRELQTVITSSCASNEPPVIPPPFANGTYNDTIKAGDFVQFNINVYDTLRADNPKNDSIFFYASGIQFGNNFTDSTSGCLNPPCATLTNNLPDTAVGTYTTQFSWQSSCDHIADNTPTCVSTQNAYSFIIRAFDDFCPAAGQSIATITIVVQAKDPVPHPDIHCADVQADGSVIIDWNAPADPDSSFLQWKIYSATNINGPYTLIDSIASLASTTYTDLINNANNQSIHYIVRAESGCDGNWLNTAADTISTMYIDPVFNGNCIQVNWNELDNPLPAGSDVNYQVFREFPIGSGFSLYRTQSGTSFCDTFSICTDSVTYRIFIGNTGNGCTGSSSNINGVRFQHTLPTQTLSFTDINCFGINDGTAWTVVANGNPPYTYAWSNGQNNDTIQGLSAANYTLTLTDSKGCLDTGTVLISQPTALISSVSSSTDVSCLGFTDGQAIVTVTGGTLPYTYNWSDSQSSDTARNLAVGLYQVTVTDNNGCTDSSSVSISQPTALLISINSSINISCNGLSDGSISMSVSGGTTPYSYLWSNTQTSASISNLPAGSYTVTITDNNGCTSTANRIITEPPLLITNAVAAQVVSCNGGNDGEAIAIANGGTAPYTYLWSNNLTTDTIRSLTANSYTVTITDNNGCTESSTVVINEPALLSSSINYSVQVSCNGLSDGSAAVTTVGGTSPYTYLWSDNQASDTARNLSAGNYFVIITDQNGCSDSAAISISQPNQLIGSIGSSTNVSCNGLGDGQATVTANGGTLPYTYLWSDNQNTASATNLIAGSYIVTLSDANGCTDTAMAIINQPLSLSNIITLGSNVSCNGLADGVAYVTASGGSIPYTYLWSDNQATDTARNLTATTYTVTVTDFNGCTDTNTIVINEPSILTSGIASSTDVSCYGLADGQAISSSSGGTLPYTYNWNNNQSTDTAFNLIAGNYTVTLTDANGCTSSSNILISQPDSLNLNASTLSNVSCNGLANGVALVTTTGGSTPYTYLWSDNQQTDTAINLSAATYTISVRDQNNCLKIDSVQISEPNRLSSSGIVNSNASCHGFSDGWAKIQAMGGTLPYTYLWSDNQTVDSASNLMAAIYTVTITDSNACVEIDSIQINDPDSLIATNIGQAISCFGLTDGQIATTANGGTTPYTYIWSNNQTTDSIFNLAAGRYSLTVSDSNNCTDTTSYLVIEPAILSINLSADDTICVNSIKTIAAIVNGGTSPYSYDWSNSSTNTNVINVSPNNNSRYYVSVTDRNNCPIVIDSVDISVRNLQDDPLSLTSTGDICANDSSQLSYVHQGDYPPYTYIFNNGLPNLNPQWVSPTTSTQYILGVRDICNNIISDTVLVQVSDLPAINLRDTIIEECVPFTIIPRNQTPSNYNYVWRFGNGDSSQAANPFYTYNQPGNYLINLVVSTPEGCENRSTADYRIIANPTPASSITASTTQTDLDNATISFSSDFSDAIAWSWNFGNGDTSSQSMPSITYQDTGRYLVLLRESNQFNCEDSSFVEIYITPTYTIRIPNVFTPNTNGSTGGRYNPNDLSNTIFYPFIEYTETYHLMIFNRWGELVFESKDVNIGWDGYYKGKLSQADVYVYKLEVTFINGEKASKVGDVTLLR